MKTMGISFLVPPRASCSATPTAMVFRTPANPVLPGWTVFADVNSTGVLAGNDPSAVTNSNGNYTITGLLPGQDTFRLVPQTGMTVETTPPSAQIYSGSTLSFSFAVKQLPASISGVEYEDGNGDGTFGAADATVAGLQVYIDSNNTWEPRRR